MEQGKIWFPNAPWRDEWDTELASFPYAKHDDQVDVLSYAAQHITTRERIRMTGWRLDPGLRKPSGFGP
jgi:phage terminase large subunit-like protein